MEQIKTQWNKPLRDSQITMLTKLTDTSNYKILMVRWFKILCIIVFAILVVVYSADLTKRIRLYKHIEISEEERRNHKKFIVIDVLLILLFLVLFVYICRTNKLF